MNFVFMNGIWVNLDRVTHIQVERRRIVLQNGRDGHKFYVYAKFDSLAMITEKRIEENKVCLESFDTKEDAKDYIESLSDLLKRKMLV